MMRYLFFVFISISSIVLFAQNINIGDNINNQIIIIIDTTNNDIDGSVISFINTNYNVGNVTKGINLTYEFEFFNTGNEPLLITNVRASCSCTVASYPKTPILSGKSGKISLELSTDNLGEFNKVVAVYSNAMNDFDDTMNKSRIVLRISWNVIEETDEIEDIKVQTYTN